MAIHVLLLLLLAPAVSSVTVEVSSKGLLMRKDDNMTPSLMDIYGDEVTPGLDFGPGCEEEDAEEEVGQKDDDEEAPDDDDVDSLFFDDAADIHTAFLRNRKRKLALPLWSKACAAECRNKSQSCAKYLTCRRTLGARFELATKTKCFNEKYYREFLAKREAARSVHKRCSANSTSNYYSKEARGCFAALEEEISTAKAEYTKACNRSGTQRYPKPSDCIMTEECKKSTRSYDSCSQQASKWHGNCMWESRKSDDKCAEQKQYKEKACGMEKECHKNRRECKHKHKVFEKTSCFDENTYQKYRLELKELFGACAASATNMGQSMKCWSESTTARHAAREEFHVECSKVGSKPPPACSIGCSHTQACSKATLDVTACLENVCAAGVKQ